jgi:ferritin-like metal-binding protein YciE
MTFPTTRPITQIRKLAMKMKTLEDLFVHELKDLYAAEKQLTKALPKMAKAATHQELREAFNHHLKQTEEHLKRLDEIFLKLQLNSRGAKCKAMEGLVEEGKEILAEDMEDDVRVRPDLCRARGALRNGRIRLRDVCP